jgi:hypothetical protein
LAALIKRIRAESIQRHNNIGLLAFDNILDPAKRISSNGMNYTSFPLTVKTNAKV